eukprot:gene41605-51538_t
MGQNGAGKSTPERGTMLLNGKPIRPSSTLEAQELGISTVYQEVNLCPNLSVAENIFIGRYPRKWGRIDWKRMQGEAARMLALMEIDIDVTKPLSNYSLAVQQMVLTSLSRRVSGTPAAVVLVVRLLRMSLRTMPDSSSALATVPPLLLVPSPG